MECPGNPASAGRAAGSLIRTIAATSVGSRVTTPTTATATVREAADAAGLALGPDLGPDLVAVATTLAAAVTSGKIALRRTPEREAGRHLQVVPDPEPQSVALVRQCAVPEVLPGGPGRQSAGTVVLAPDPAPDREDAVCPDPDLVLAP